MSKKHIRVSPFDPRSIQAALDEAVRFRTQLREDMRKLIEAMCQDGEQYAINAVGHVDTGETLNSIGYRTEDGKGVIFAGGNAVWIEFGAGVARNGPAGSYPHPKAAELGMSAIGTYGEGHGADPAGWYYYEGGEWHHTRGIEANMFMFKTAQMLQSYASKYAWEAFGR